MPDDFTLLVRPDHPAFAGHFPGAPIVPGVLLLDAVVHEVMQAQRKGRLPDAAGAPQACQVSAAKFLSPVGPGETLAIRCRTGSSGNIRFEISGEGRKVAEGTLVLPLQP